jgi:hypothetical protein
MGHIPAAYTHIERLFFEDVRKHKRNISIFEWDRPQWTFHAKGIFRFLDYIFRSKFFYDIDGSYKKWQ